MFKSQVNSKNCERVKSIPPPPEAHLVEADLDGLDESPVLLCHRMTMPPNEFAVVTCFQMEMFRFTSKCAGTPPTVGSNYIIPVTCSDIDHNDKVVIR